MRVRIFALILALIASITYSGPAIASAESEDGEYEGEEEYYVSSEYYEEDSGSGEEQQAGNTSEQDSIIADDTAITDEHSTVTINVIANDNLGENSGVVSVTTPLSGTAAINYDGTVSYTPAPATYPSSSTLVDTFYYSVSLADGTTFTGLVKVIVNPVNDFPIARDGSHVAFKDTDLVFYLDSFDEDGDSLTYSILSHPTAGVVVEFDETTGRVLYVPAGGFSGDGDSLTFMASDGRAASYPARIDISISEDKSHDSGDNAAGPSANPEDPASGEEPSGSDETEDDGGGNTGSQSGSSNSTGGSQQQNGTGNSQTGGGSSNTNGTGSGNEGGQSNGTNSNTAPKADAGPDMTVLEGTLVTLDGKQSSDPENDTLTHSWSQVAGPAVFLSDADSPKPTFVAPPVSSSKVIIFELVVSDGTDDSQPSKAKITVIPMSEIKLDIMPGENPNKINTNQDETIPVAILGTSIFSIQEVNDDSLRFGPDSTAPVQTEKIDVNGDGFDDLVSYYEASSTGIQSQDTEACLIATMNDNGAAFQLCDSIKVVNQN